MCCERYCMFVFVFHAYPSHHHEQVARALLEAGAAADARQPDGETSLTISCRGGHESCTRLLLEAGAAIDLALKPDAEDGPCFTALMFAAQNGHELCACALLKAGARKDVESNAGITALSLARKNGHSEICELLEA